MSIDTTIRVRERFYNEGVSYLSAENIISNLSGLQWIEFDVADIGTNSNLYSAEPAASSRYMEINYSPANSIRLIIEDETLDRLIISESFVVIIDATFPRSDGTYKINITDSGNSIDIDGVEQSLTYSAGDASTIATVGELTGANFMNLPSPAGTKSSVIGYMNNIKIGTGTTTLADFSKSTEEQFFDSISDTECEYGETHTKVGQTEIDHIGYASIPLYVQNKLPFYAPSPFKKIPADLTTPPTDAQRAYLRRTTDQTPIILSGLPYPDWTSFAAADVEWNPDCWAYSKALTCFSVLSEWQTFKSNATLLSPRHVLLAEHIRDDFPSESWKRDQTFMQLDGSHQTERIIDYENINGTDVTIGYLENEITLDVEYAAFLTDLDSEAFNYRTVWGCGPSKEGIFTIEKLTQMFSMGVEDRETGSSDEWYWSRYNNADSDTARVGDSQRPCFIYHGEILFLQFTAVLSGTYPYHDSGSSVLTDIQRGISNPLFKHKMKRAMDKLDAANSATASYELRVEEIV